MAFWLYETELPAGDRAAATARLDDIAARAGNAGGDVIEAQISAAQDKAFVVMEHDDQFTLARAMVDGGVAPPLTEVRLVGQTIDEVKATRGNAQYLVEWDFPAGLEMDTYLARKKAKSPLYAQVPEVRFLRTWVREDMVKCLCLYEADTEEDVLRARQVVETPVDRLTKLAVSEHVGG